MSPRQQTTPATYTVEAYQQPLLDPYGQPAAPGMPYQAVPTIRAPMSMPMRVPTVITVPIPVDTTGLGLKGGVCFETNCYSLALDSVMTRQEFDYIVEQLNACAAKHGPNQGRYQAGMWIPLLGHIPRSILESQCAHFKKELEATCLRITQTSGREGFNMRVVSGATSPRRRRAVVGPVRIDMEVIV